MKKKRKKRKKKQLIFFLYIGYFMESTLIIAAILNLAMCPFRCKAEREKKRKMVEIEHN